MNDKNFIEELKQKREEYGATAVYGTVCTVVWEDGK